MPDGSNWGRWGPDDELGTLNYITPEVVRHAASLVRQGTVYSLAIPLVPGQPIWGERPVLHFMMETGQNAPAGVAFSDDYLSMPTHGTTHWDSLAHVFEAGKIYNGYEAAREITPDGVGRNAVGRAADRFVTRGVLLDVARRKGGVIEGGYEITVEDLEDAARGQNVEVRPGDALLIRTGWLRMWAEDPAVFKAAEPGIGWEASQWLKEKHVAAVASDNLSVEVLPARRPGFAYPLHVELIRNQGMMLGELFHLDDLSEACAEDGVYEFLFAGQPLRLMRGTGSPAHPLAIR